MLLSWYMLTLFSYYSLLSKFARSRTYRMSDIVRCFVYCYASVLFQLHGVFFCLLLTCFFGILRTLFMYAINVNWCLRLGAPTMSEGNITNVAVGLVHIIQLSRIFSTFLSKRSFYWALVAPINPTSVDKFNKISYGRIKRRKCWVPGRSQKFFCK